MDQAVQDCPQFQDTFQCPKSLNLLSPAVTSTLVCSHSSIDMNQGQGQIWSKLQLFSNMVWCIVILQYQCNALEKQVRSTIKSTKVRTFFLEQPKGPNACQCCKTSKNKIQKRYNESERAFWHHSRSKLPWIQTFRNSSDKYPPMSRFLRHVFCGHDPT